MMKDKHRSAAECFDDDWEAKARTTIASTGHDPDLGIAAARDALGVVTGEIEQTEFLRRHHEGYLREFKLDERSPLPIKRNVAPADTAGTAGSDARTGDVGRAHGEPHALLSRRNALRMFGGGAAALFAGGLLMRSPLLGAGSAGDEGSPAVPQTSTPDEDVVDSLPVRWGMVIDLENCTGCLACVAGCHEENGLSDGVHWIYSLAFSDENRDDPNFLVRPCMHCSNAPCVKVCPVAARHVRKADGLVLTDYDTCIGCRYCEVACPYGVNYFQWGEPSSYGGSFSGERKDVQGRSVIGDPPKGVMGKCTFCPQRVDDTGRRGTAGCVLACPHESLFIGDLNDPESAPRQHLARRRRENPDLSTFRLLDELGTEPNVIYIGQEPTLRAKAVEAPTTYEDWGFLDDRRAALESPDAWFTRLIGRD